MTDGLTYTYAPSGGPAWYVMWLLGPLPEVPDA